MHERAAVATPSKSLSGRLEALLALVERVDCLADVGTDHALVPAHAVLRGLCQRAIAVDVREAPLASARTTVTALGVAEQVRLVRGDALGALEGVPVDAVVLAGLSGNTLLAWLRAAPGVVSGLRRLIVQPNRGLAELRRWAHAEGLWLVDENLCQERGRTFVSCAFEHGTGADPAYTESELAFEHAVRLGPWLARRRAVEAYAYYTGERRRLQQLVDAGRQEHAPELAAFEAGCRLFA